MSTVRTNNILDASGGNTATINSMTPTADSLQGQRNRIINGDMRIDQRNAGAAVTADGSYIVDRFTVTNGTDGAFSAQQDSSVPTGFVNSLKFTTTTADGTLTTTQRAIVRQMIEGTNVSDLAWGTANAKTVTLSFWVRSSLTGTFGGALSNSASDRSYPFTYTISAANTWEQKTITIAGDTTGTWLTTTGVGLRVIFGLGVGPDRSGTAGAWAGAQYVSATGATSVIGTLNATWYITGVQLEVGSVATPFERRPYGTELQLCQRYYWEMARGSLGTNGTNSWMGTGYFFNSTQINLPVMFPVTMRTSPSLNVSNTSAYFGLDTTTAQTFPTFTIFQPSVYGAMIYSQAVTGGAAGYACSAYTRNASAFCAFSAEL